MLAWISAWVRVLLGVVFGVAFSRPATVFVGMHDDVSIWKDIVLGEHPQTVHPGKGVTAGVAKK